MSVKTKIPCDWPHLDNLSLLWTQLSHMFSVHSGPMLSSGKRSFFFSEVSTIVLQHVWHVVLRGFYFCLFCQERADVLSYAVVFILEKSVYCPNYQKNKAKHGRLKWFISSLPQHWQTQSLVAAAAHGRHQPPGQKLGPAPPLDHLPVGGVLQTGETMTPAGERPAGRAEYGCEKAQNRANSNLLASTAFWYIEQCSFPAWCQCVFICLFRSATVKQWVNNGFNALALLPVQFTLGKYAATFP